VIKSTEQLRAELNAAYATFTQSVADTERYLSRSLCDVATTAAANALLFQMRADALRAARSSSDVIECDEVVMLAACAQAFIAVSREIARTIETTPGLSDPAALARLDTALVQLSLRDDGAR